MNHFYLVRRGLFKSIYKNRKYMKGKLLDFGCGRKPYRRLFCVEKYIGLDMLSRGHCHKDEQIDVYYDGATIPFIDNCFDSVFSSEVFEHIFNLDQILKEIHRVMKPEGHLLITVPFVWEEHETPYDFARYTSFGLQHLIEKTGFEIIKIEKTTHYIETIFQMWNVYINASILPSNGYLKMLLTPLIIAPITIMGLCFSKILPDNKNFYHNNLLIAKKKVDFL
jgi:SAM-dependent methyltransferase